MRVLLSIDWLLFHNPPWRDKKKFYTLTEDYGQTRNKLCGLGGLFHNQGNVVEYSSKELLGISAILKEEALKVESIQELLEYGDKLYISHLSVMWYTICAIATKILVLIQQTKD